MEPAPLPTRERQRHATRQLILKAALAEIAERGLAGARIGQIARRAGVTRPTIYAHFPRKEDFLRALQSDTERAVLHELTRRVGRARGADLVHRTVDAVFDLVDAGDPVLRRESFAWMIREPQAVDWERHPLFGSLSQRLAEAQDRGELADDVAAAELARILMTAVFGFLIVENAPAAERRRAAHVALARLLGEAAP